MKKLRNNVDRSVPWDCVHAGLKSLASRITKYSGKSDDPPVVLLNPAKMLHLQLQALLNIKAVGKIYYYREGEPWVRIGMDRVPLWHWHVLTATLSICSELVHLREHSPRRHAAVALFPGYDSVVNLISVWKHIKINVALWGLNRQWYCCYSVLAKVHCAHIFRRRQHACLQNLRQGLT